MNILVLSWRDPKHPLAGGAEQVMHEHMKGWVHSGNKVTLFSSRIKGLAREETLDRVKIIRKGDQFFGVKFAAFFYYLKNRGNIDLVLDQFHGIPFFTPLYVRKPILAILQEITKEVWFLYHLMPFPLNYLLGALGYVSEPFIFLFYRKISFMVGSESAKSDLIKMKISAKNITIVPHGVLIDLPKPFPKKQKVKTIIFLGALAKDKGIEDALSAFSILNKSGDFRFWVVGMGSPEYRRKLLQLCKSFGINDKTKFWGFVDKKKKFEFLARAHLLINPSVREGWGLVNIEANAVGTPVIAYKSPGLIDSVNNEISGILVDKNNPQELAKTIISVLNNKSKYLSLQRGAIEWSKKFSWKHSRKLSLDLLKSVLSIDK